MWTILNNQNEDIYFSKYPELDEHRESFILYKSEKSIMLPRFFYKNYPSDKLKFIDLDYTPERIDFKCNIIPRKMQEEVVNIVQDIYNKNGYISGIIKARPGSGKTILSIYIASILSLKTLIIVDSQSLQKQWIKEILSVTDLIPEDIGIIRQKYFPEGHEKVVVATVQTLLSQFKKDPKDIYTRLKNLGFGVVFLDECHKSSSSEQYTKISTILPMNNIIGLSATPWPRNEQDILMKNVIGPILYDSKDYDYVPEVNFIYYKSHLDKYRFMLGKVKDFIQRKALYNKIVCRSNYFLRLFPKFIKEDLENKHKIIVICQTENQIKRISDELNENNIPHRKYYGKERIYDKDDNVLLVTYSFAGTGFDFKELSSLIYACPLSGKISLIQTAGRILRTCDNKQQPKIRYLIDMTFPSQSLTELKYAKNVFTNEFNGVKFNEIEMYDGEKDNANNS